MIHEQEQLRLKASQMEKLQREHQRTKEQFQEMEARYRALFDRSIHCIYLHDLEGKFLDANPARLALSGYTREELLGGAERRRRERLLRLHLQATFP